MTYQSQWLASEKDVMAIRSFMGATSVAYRKFAPKNPIGTNVLKKKMKNAAAICALSLLFGNEVLIARATMHDDMPTPLIMKTARRPKRSIQMNPRKDEMNFQVSVPPDRMRDISVPSSRLSWKRMVE